MEKEEEYLFLATEHSIFFLFCRDGLKAVRAAHGIELPI